MHTLRRSKRLRLVPRCSPTGGRSPSSTSPACGFQPLVFSDQAIDRVQDVDGSDFAALVEVTLPVTVGVQLPIQFDQIRQAWIVSSANPNLRVASHVGPIPMAPGGPPALGFVITVGASFLQVGRYRHRQFLRDGYHRAFGFLSRGITVVPAFVREMNAFEDLVPDCLSCSRKTAIAAPVLRCLPTTSTTPCRRRFGIPQCTRWSSSKHWS